MGPVWSGRNTPKGLGETRRCLWGPGLAGYLSPGPAHPRYRSCHGADAACRLADRDGLTSAAGQRWAICWRISDWPLLAAAVTAGAGIADRFRVVMPPGMMIIVDAGA
jgi:DNA-binding transcriptional LysR family regulator